MSQDTTSNNKLIAKNTMYLYVRMLFTMIVGLYTTRVVLQVLGESDYGLYNVIGGILTMFTMISAALQTGTQRFLSFAIGEKNEDKLKKTFSIALGLHVITAAIIVILAETIGLWFLNSYINIPEGRECAAFWLYQFTIIGFVFSFIQIPFQSCLIAHEKMNMYAYMSIYDAAFKLFIVFLIQWVTFDRLIAYGMFLLFVQIGSILIYNIYCRKKFIECQFSISFDKELTKEIAAYSGWNILGGSVNLFANQGVNFLLNIFCGTIVNAARGLSMTVSSIANTFVSNFQVAVNPQIVKLFAAKEYSAFYRLLINNCRAATYLFLLIAIPIIIEADFILKVWLGEYPKYTDIFIQIMLIELYFRTINQPIQYSIHASGQMKWQNIVNSALLCLIFPFSWIALKNGLSPVSVFIISAFFWSTNNICNLFFSHKYTGLPVLLVLKEVYLNSFIGIVLMFLTPFLLSTQMDSGLVRFLSVGIVSVITSVFVIYFWGLTPGMKHMIISKIKQVKQQ